MATKRKSPDVSVEDINKVTEILGKLVLQGKFVHMKMTVQSILGGLLLPHLVDKGAVPADDPSVMELIAKYSREEVKKLLNPDPIPVEVEKIVETIIHDRPVFRRIKSSVNKEKRIQRKLDPAGRDILIRWWNVNQRLIPNDDPVCVTLTDQVNSINPNDKPLSPMQIAGYFSHLCRMGLRTEIERTDNLNRAIKRGFHSVMPEYTQPLIEAIKENWERERALEATRAADHAKLLELRANGSNKPVIAQI